MNGFNTAFFAPGGPGYIPYVPPATPPPVYTGTDPTIYSTDQPALIPQVETPLQDDPVWFDLDAPLDFTGMSFPDEPVSTPSIFSPPATYDWPAPLEPSFSPPPPVSYIPELAQEGIVFPSGPVPAVPSIFAPAASESSEPLWFNWQEPLSFEGMYFPEPGIIEEQDVRTGPLESLWKFAGDVVKGVGDVAKFVVDHLDVGVSYRGEYGGVKTQKAYYSSVGAPAPTILGIPGGAAPSVSTRVSAGGGPAGGPPMTEEERLWREATKQGESDTNKFLMYAGGALLVYKLLSK